MTSGQCGEWVTFSRVPLRFLAALILFANSGCAPFQKTWANRLDGDRLASTPIPEPIRSVPVDVESSPDPYAARLASGNPGAGWSPASDPSGIPLPPPGAVPLAPPPPEIAAGNAAGTFIDPIEEQPLPVEDSPTAIMNSPATDPGVNPSVVDDFDAIHHLMDQGIALLSSYRNYRATLDRQERVRETLLPAEKVVLSVRTEPFAVRLEWPDGPNKGREVLYSEPGTECDGMMHVKLGKTLIPVPPMQLDPKSPIALSNGRHPITEAGLLHILTQTKAQVELSQAGDLSIGRFELRGPLIPAESDSSCLEIVRTTPTGEYWRLVLDEETILPILLEATDGNGQLLERYHFQNIETDLAELDDSNAFNPSVRFGRPIVLPVDRIASGVTGTDSSRSP